MATRNIVVTYPDAAATRISAALKAHYGPVTEGEPPVTRDRTTAEAFEAFEASVKDSLRHIVRNVEKQEREAAAKAAAQPDPEVT